MSLEKQLNERGCLANSFLREQYKGQYLQLAIRAYNFSYNELTLHTMHDLYFLKYTFVGVSFSNELLLTS